MPAKAGIYLPDLHPRFPGGEGACRYAENARQRDSHVLRGHISRFASQRTLPPPKHHSQGRNRPHDKPQLRPANSLWYNHLRKGQL